MRLYLTLLLMLPGLSSVANPLTALAPDALVVVGDAAPMVEMQAAQRLAAALRAAGGPENNLQSADKINTDLELASRHHLLVVGTEMSNRVMERLPSHWTLNRDIYFKTHQPVHPYEPTVGFYMAGYGTFTTGAAGYIECDRNPYWHYATNLLSTQQVGPYRQIIRLYGNSPEGVAAAVEAFLTRNILTGPAVPQDKMPDAMSLWTLDTSHLALPDTAPDWLKTAEVFAGDLSLTFVGWQVADSMLYAGFKEITGVSASKIWRAKFLTEKGWDYPMNVIIDPSHPMTRSPLFEASLARRATDNEWFITQLASPQQAAQARDAMETYLTKRKESHAPWTDAPANGIAWRRSRFGVNLAVIGDYLAMESFGDQHDALALRLINIGGAQ